MTTQNGHFTAGAATLPGNSYALTLGLVWEAVLGFIVAQVAAQSFAVAEACTLRNGVEFLRCGRQFCLSGLGAQTGDESCRSCAHLLGKYATEVALAHSGSSRQRRYGEIGVEIFGNPGNKFANRLMVGSLRGQLSAELFLGCAAPHHQHHSPRDFQRQCMAVIFLDHR